MPSLLLEVGCEELPAHSVARAAEELGEAVMRAIQERSLAEDSSQAEIYATPRRLIVSVSGLREAQPDQSVERRGPSESACFGPDGAPTKALEGFCKSAGILPEQAQIRDGYAWAIVEMKGKRAAEALSEDLPNAIRSLTFDKTMRWGESRMRFARPIRWILAILDGEIIPFAVETVQASNTSRGHRFHFPDAFEVSSLEQLLSELRSRMVEPDANARRARIVESAERLAGGRALLTDALVEENVYLTEWPVAIVGTFKEEYRRLPRPVLITAMAKHERFFPIEDEQGNLTNRFISVTNGGDEEEIRQGNEWVLNARFNDAMFFFDEDRRKPLSYFLEQTSRIVFQEKLGTIRQRADRLSALAKAIADESQLGIADLCERAGLLCKADLSTGLVSELPSLQGQIGAEYARIEGEDERICRGVAQHYDAPREPANEGDQIAIVLMCADAADRIAGYLGIGEKPTGSRDPFALRKAATQLIEAQIGWESLKGSFVEWVQRSANLYESQSIALSSRDSIETDFCEIVTGRYEAMFPDISYDAREAALATSWKDPARTILQRARILQSISPDVPFVRTAKRPINIVSAAEKKEIGIASAVKPEHFEHPSESDLLGAIERAEFLAEGRQLDELVDVLRSLASPIDAFFDAVMVMAENETIRANRLALLKRASSLFLRIGDFSKIVIEGE